MERKKTRLREETKGGMSEMEQGRKREDDDEINRMRQNGVVKGNNTNGTEMELPH